MENPINMENPTNMEIHNFHKVGMTFWDEC